MPAKAPISMARVPLFSKALSAACSLKTSAALSYPKPAKPMRVATSEMIFQSALLSPATGRKARCREILRSELVTVPSFSPQAAAGRSTWARRVVSVSRMASLTTTKGHCFKASRTASASGMLTTGLVAIIQMALMRPSRTASNMSTALRPGFVAIAGACPEALHEIAVNRILNGHVGCQHIGEATNLPPSHGVGLARH